MVRLLSILCIPLSMSYGIELIELLFSFNIADTMQSSFLIATVGSTLFCSKFVRSDSYLAIFEHEFVHNIMAFATFKKPVGFSVQRGYGGHFEYYGSGNLLIILGPYFFPTIPALVFPFYWVIDENYLRYFYALLGLGLGFQMVTNFKETHSQQSDLKVYGLVYSYLLIVFLNIIVIGCIFGFVQTGFNGISEFFTAGFNNIYNTIIYLYPY